MSIVYLDTETTGLDPTKHEVWQIAYALGGSPIRSSLVAHHGITADPVALEMNHYHDQQPLYSSDPEQSQRWERELIEELHGTTLCGANPGFDMAFLQARWGVAPWRYRLLDIEAYAMGALGYVVPKGLKDIAADLVARGHNIPAPDHTAAGDVATLRECHWALQGIYATARTTTPTETEDA